MPPSGPLELTWKNDLDFGIPLMARIGKQSHFKKNCKKKFQNQVWVANLHDEELITTKQIIKKRNIYV